MQPVLGLAIFWSHFSASAGRPGRLLRQAGWVLVLALARWPLPVLGVFFRLRGRPPSHVVKVANSRIVTLAVSQPCPPCSEGTCPPLRILPYSLSSDQILPSQCLPPPALSCCVIPLPPMSPVPQPGVGNAQSILGVLNSLLCVRVSLDCS